MIDFFGENKLYAESKDQILSILDKTLTNEAFLRGKPIHELEQKCSSVLGRKYSVAVNSGTDALAIALKSIGIGKGDEVIVSAFSFVASASPILMVGAIPVFVDIDPDTYLMDVKKVESSITSKTKAIIAVQLYGQCMEPSSVEMIAKKHKLWLIEDAAQAFGANRDERAAGSIGDVSTISFDVSKVVSGLTTGGIIVTDNEDLYKNAVALRSHGRDNQTGDFQQLGFNSQMSSINAAILSWKIEIEDSRRAKRIEIANRYLERLAQIPEIKAPVVVSNGVHNFHKFVIRVPNRDGLKKFLKQSGIETKIHYTKPIPYYKVMESKYKMYTDLQVAFTASKEVLSLPIYPELSMDKADFISDRIIEFYKK